MSGANLIFGKPPTGGALVFGDDTGSSSAGQVIAALDFPAFRVQALVAPRIAVQASVALPEFSASAQARYDQNVSRPVAADARSAWQIAHTQPELASSRWQDAATLAALAAARWRRGTRTQQSAASRWQDGARTGRTTAAHWQHGRRTQQAARSRWQDGTRIRYASASAWQHGQRIQQTARSHWQEMLRTARPSIITHWQSAARHRHAIASAYGAGRAVPVWLTTRWQQGQTPPPGKWAPGIEPEHPQRPPNPHLVFERPPMGPHLVFGWVADEALVVIPTRSAYIVINSVTLRRTDSNAAIEPLSLEISTDADSWLPSFSAEIAFNEFAALAAENGEPLELEAIINGQRWLMLAEGAPSRSRAFGKTSVQIRGRGKAAWLDDPYADHVNVIATADRTAQQLMAEALTSNGASLGWALDWQITDWLVPGGVWSHQGSPMAGVLDVAAAAQAIVQADAAASTLHILPRYPALPWDWASTTPDVQIPLDVIETDSLEPVVQPEYNAVFVAGEGGGIVGHVKRAGTAADRVAPSAGHRLITHADAARQHGGAILANAGRQARITISMPISAEIPLLQVGQLVSIPEPGDNWRGLVRGVRVSAAWQQSLRVRQTIEIERHYL